MSGTWLTLGAVGALALGSELSVAEDARGSTNRQARVGMGLLLLAGAGGVLYWNRAQVRPVLREVRDTVRETLPDLPPPTVEPVVEVQEGGLPPGVSVQSNVVWSPSTLAFVRKMRSLLPSEVKLEISSATRTPERQAAAMLTKYQDAEKKRGPGGGAREIEDIYGSKAKYFLEAKPYTKERWAEVVRYIQTNRLGFRTGHLVGTAVDIHTRTLPKEQVDLLVQAAQRAGGKTLLETYPPHLHVEVPALPNDRAVA
jgi:hypothetical protein